VTVRLSDELRLKADGVVIFPQLYAGNTEWVKNGKYTDFDFFHDGRISADTFGRTDNIRVFSAGSGSCNEYFLLNKRLVSSNPIVSYEQGFNVGQNMQALVQIELLREFLFHTSPSNISLSGVKNCCMLAQRNFTIA
jgi:hypothetical protein